MRRVVLAVLVLSCAMGADWPRFRGPSAEGICTPDAPGPTTWSASSNVKWKVETPGFGASSPVTKGDKVFITGYSGYGEGENGPGSVADIKYHVACYNRADGGFVWSQNIDPARSPETSYERFSALHGYASPTPVVDDNNVYAFFGNSGVYAMTLDGKDLWRADVGARAHGWNVGASPLVWNNLVIVNASIESGSVVALDKATGEKVWTVDGINDSWGTPLIVDVSGERQELVVCHKGETIGVDPATGEKLWRCDSVQDYICPSVIAKDGICYITAGRKPFFMAVRAGGRGDVTGTHVLWTVETTSKVPTPVLVGDHLYFLDQRGTAFCLDAKTGKTVYEERLDLAGRGDKVYSSPVAMDGKLYCFSREDGCVVLPAEPRFELLSKNDLGDDSVFNATPVADGGQIIVRSDRYLYCIEAE